jgi:hypothetical protein
MRRYLDLIAYPIALVSVYILIGLVRWERDPAMWELADRCVWVVWGLAWGWGLQCRINRGGR